MRFSKYRKWLLAGLLATTFVFASAPLSAQVVMRKPSQPNEVMRAPERPSSSAIWMPGTWRWSDHKHAYEWRPSHWVERKGKKRKWQQGKWVAVRKGFKWMSGKWVK